MPGLKLTTWNVQHLSKLVGSNLSRDARRRRDGVVRQIHMMNPDILCLIEGPRGEETIDEVAAKLLHSMYVPIKSDDGEYKTKGAQWVWFLVKEGLAERCSLLPTRVWEEWAGSRWPVHFWGEHDEHRHGHYRHPQTLILDWFGQRVEFIGLHLKSKFVNRGSSLWKDEHGGGRERFVAEAIKARIKLATEASNVRAYIEAKFRQIEQPAIFVLGDLNDGPGKEYFERRYLFFDLVGNIQGDVFFAKRFLNHGLFDFPDDLRWTVRFRDFVDPSRDPHILLDHVLFTQPLVRGALPLKVGAKAGFVEHEIHDLINGELTRKQETSDHRPVSLRITTDRDYRDAE